MKEILNQINKVFDNRIRLGIMSVLMVNEYLDFNSLKELLNLTDGNLASHIKSLESEDYIIIEKSFIGKKTNTTYKVSQKGKIAFQEHLTALERLIEKSQG